MLSADPLALDEVVARLWGNTVTTRETRLNDGGLVLIPPPTNRRDDPLDGIVTIGPSLATSPAAATTSALQALDEALTQAGQPINLARNLLRELRAEQPPSPALLPVSETGGEGRLRPHSTLWSLRRWFRRA